MRSYRLATHPLSLFRVDGVHEACDTKMKRSNVNKRHRTRTKRWELLWSGLIIRCPNVLDLHSDLLLNFSSVQCIAARKR